MVGAGLSGLLTARGLIRRGIDVTVLEAADRVGGRTCAETIGRGTFDLGGQWIGPSQHRMTALADELGLATFPTYDTGRKVLDVDGRISTYAGSIPSLSPVKLAILQATIWRIDRQARRVYARDPWNAPDASVMDGRTLQAWMSATVPSRLVRDVMTTAIRVIFGAEPRDLSLLFAMWYIGQGGGILSLVDIRDAAQATRFVDGAHAVSRRLAEEMGDAVVLGSPVTAIDWGPEGVIVRTPGREWRADRLVMAAPSNMATRIVFDPVLPASRRALMDRFPIGATIKFHALYDRAFWREAGLSGELVCTSGPVSVVFDNTSHDGRQPALTGFCVGEAALRVSELPDAEQRRVFEDVLARGFGEDARGHTHLRIKDWTIDPWVQGCPTGIMPPGVLGTFGPALRAPVGPLHWAGTETAREWTGYMEGAAEAAERVVEEITGCPPVPGASRRRPGRGRSTAARWSAPG